MLLFINYELWYPFNINSFIYICTHLFGVNFYYIINKPQKGRYI